MSLSALNIGEVNLLLIYSSYFNVSESNTDSYWCFRLYVMYACSRTGKKSLLAIWDFLKVNWKPCNLILKYEVFPVDLRLQCFGIVFIFFSKYRGEFCLSDSVSE